ncbi:hypothetical protein CVT24_007885 [Panaeolus cyanescens]|uniref:BED-type domain-containing protein n=1 Tax=Panaeolus cyanescens TaxID=181874 RepID=A0A409YQJ7_9AGAR|nr:hypothetical protein CVT24_007885 [Panaeolus cyanescens]
MHKDVQVQPIDISDDEGDVKPLNASNPIADIQHFFTDAPRENNKPRKFCNPCGGGKVLSAEHTTLRRHMKKHRGIYYKWAKDNNFDSMIPGDPAMRKKAAEDAKKKIQQTQMDNHFEKEDPTTKPERYSDEAFSAATTEWIVQTNQPIQASEHPSFKRMINLAAQATRGIAIPSRKQNRRNILRMFKQRMKKLKKRLNVRFDLPSH